MAIVELRVQVEVEDTYEDFGLEMGNLLGYLEDEASKRGWDIHDTEWEEI